MRFLLLELCIGLAGCAEAPSGDTATAPAQVTVSRPVQRDATHDADVTDTMAAVDSIEAPRREWGNAMTESRIFMVHVRLTADRPFADVHAAFERQLGKFEPEVYQALAEDGDPGAARTRIEAMAGPSGFILFGKNDHGRLLRIVGQQRKAVQYVIGNPLLAVEMTRHAIGASLYAPLRVLIYEADDGKTCIEYDKPSSLFGQFGNSTVDEVAAALDRKLEDLAATATR